MLVTLDTSPSLMSHEKGGTKNKLPPNTKNNEQDHFPKDCPPLPAMQSVVREEVGSASLMQEVLPFCN